MSLCAAILAALLVSSCNSQKPATDSEAVTLAEDEVYEAVVRELVTPNGEAHVAQLVFNKNALSDWTFGEDANACKQRVLKRYLPAVSDTPHFNSFADKAYRFFTRPSDDTFLEVNTTQDLAEKLCTKHPLSTSFHTNLPHIFIDPDSVYFDDGVVTDNRIKNFTKTYPGAAGIISLSSVGFDPGLREGTVTVSLVCGMLCGTGWRYIIKRTSNGWVVTKKWIIWVS